MTVVENNDHPLSRTMREEHLREAVLEAYHLVRPAQADQAPVLSATMV